MADSAKRVGKVQRVKRDGRYRGTSIIREIAPLGPYTRTMPRVPWWPQGRGLFLMSEVPL